MTKVSVPQKDGEVVVYDGEKSTSYPVKDGVITIAAGHVAAVLHAMPGSELTKPEAPAKEAT
jgi:GH24 family phage-related lysozyme (muramidase)